MKLNRYLCVIYDFILQITKLNKKFTLFKVRRSFLLNSTL